MENIGNIHFRKGIQPKKAEKKETQKQAPTQENQMTEQERTVLEKIRSKAISSYITAAMMLGTGATAMTSCSESTSWVDDNDEELKQFMKQMIELMNIFIKNQEKNNEQNETMIGQNKVIIEQNNKRAEENTKMLMVMTDIYSGIKDIKTGISEVTNILRDGNKYDVQFLNKLDTIIQGQETDQAKMEALIKLAQERNQTLSNIEAMINATMEKDQALGNTLMKFYEAFVTSDQRNEEYQNTHTDFMEKALQELKNSNAIDTATLYEIQQFHKDYKEGKIEESVMWENITNILTGIKDELGQIKDAILDISANIVKYGDAFLEKQDKQIDILSNMNGNITNIGKDVKDLKQLQKENNETLVNLANSVDQINVKLEQIKEKQGDMITIDQLRDLVGPSFNQIIDILGGIHGSQISIEQVKEAMETYKTDLSETNALIATLTNAVENLQLKGDIDALKGILLDIKDEIKGNRVDIDELISKFPNYTEILNEIREEIGDHVTAEDIQNIYEKTDLTKTNNLIETLTTVVQNLQLGGDNEGLKELADKLASLQNSVDKSNEEKLAALDGIRSDLAGIKGSLDVLVKTANDIKTNQDKFMAQAQAFGTKLFEELGKIGSKQFDPAKLEVLAESYKEQLVLAQQTRTQKKEILQTIAENMGKGTGGSVDVDDLIAKLPNYTTVLNEIRDKIGDHVTAEDIKNIYEKTDLTKTNNLIETLTTVVQNINVGGGSSSGGSNNQVLESIKTSVNQILTTINNGQLASEQQINAILEAIGRLENNTQTRGTYVHEGWIYE